MRTEEEIKNELSRINRLLSGAEDFEEGEFRTTGDFVKAATLLEWVLGYED